MQNAWLSAHLHTLEKITRLLTEWEYMPIFQDYPLATIQQLFKGFRVEVSRLQNEVDILKKENQELKKKLEPKKEEPPQPVEGKGKGKKGA